MPEIELHYLTIYEAAALIRSRKLSPVELVRAFLDRIERVDGLVHSYINVFRDHALASARQAEAEIMAGGYRGPLHGVPYGLKDNYMVAGMPMTANSRLTIDFVPDTNATVHERLKAAGAVLIGKLNTYEFGTGNGDNLFELPFPPARNPWNLDCFPGGSTTGGGAAVAAGTAMLAMGTDTGGSVRLPAAACGAAGLKPTYGVLSRAGILPNCYSMDCAGPITWSALDIEPVLTAVAGHDPLDPASARRPPVPADATDVRDWRIGVVRRFHERDIPTDPDLVGAFDRCVETFAKLGAEIIEFDLPYGLQDFRNCSRLINAAESHSIHETDFRERRAAMGVALREKLYVGQAVGSVDYLRAQRWRRQLAGSVDGLLGRCDVLICCGSTRLPASYEDRAAVVAFTTESAQAAFSLSGHPAMSVCSGFSSDGLPLNLQIAGKRFHDLQVTVAARALERALALKKRRPRIAGPVQPPGAPSWTSLPRKEIDEAEALRQAQGTVAATLAGLPSELPREIEPFPVVDMGG